MPNHHPAKQRKAEWCVTLTATPHMQKYTKPSPQPIGDLLYLLKNAQGLHLRVLCKEWGWW